MLISVGERISLKLDEYACDVTSFRRLLAEGSESALAQAISLYRYPLLQGFTLAEAPLFEEWVRFEESALRQSYLAALQQLASWAESREAWNEAIHYVQRFVQLDPLSEDMQRRLIGLYQRTRAPGQALRQYQQFEMELKRELGLTPSAETQALLSAALQLRRTATAREKTLRRLSVRPPEALPFVGRDTVLKKLLAMSQAAALLREFPGVQDEQLLPTIEDLVVNGLLVEVAHDRFALAHHLLCETLLLPLSHLRRRMIHCQLTVILEAYPALQRYFPLRQLALHAVIGEDVERARRYGLQVLDELAQDNANAQTLEFLHQLYDLLAPTASPSEMLRLSHALGQVHRSLGQLEEAATWYQQYLDLARQTADPATQAAAHFELG